MNIAASEKASGLLGVLRNAGSGPSEKGHAKGLHEQPAASAADRASMAPTAGTRNFSIHCGSFGLSRTAET